MENNKNNEYCREPLVEVRYEYQSLSVRTYGFFLGLLTGIIGLFIIFAWKNEEDRKQFLSGWFTGLLTIIFISLFIIGFISCAANL